MQNLDFSEKKAGKLLFLALLIVLGAAYPIYSFIFLIRQAQARQMEREYIAAVEQLNQGSRGVPKAEVFIRRINEISSERAPVEIRRDLEAYADTLNQALQAFKAGENANTYDKKIGEEKSKLIADFKKYD